MANYEYGILSEPASYETATINYEMGWNFTTVKEFYFYGFRVKSPKVAEKVCTLWDSSQNAIATATLATIVGEWVEVLLDEPILLEAGKEYTISTWTDSSYYYKANATSYFTFNTECLTFKNGKAGNIKGAYPRGYTTTYIYPMIDCLISNEPPNIKRYLVRDGNTIYTVTDGALVEVVGDLNAQLFIDNGVDAIPDGTLLMTLSNPEVLCWTDDETLPTLTATVKGIPEPQTVMSKEIDLMHSSIKGINGVTVDCKGDVLFAVSFDKKATWMMHNGTEFVEVSDKLAGMTKTEFEAITAEQWKPKYEASSDMYIRCILFDETQSITTVNIDFIN